MSDISLVQHSISASSPDGLRRAMLNLQLRRQTKFKFHSITFAQGKWWAFYEDRDASVKFTEKLPRESS